MYSNEDNYLDSEDNNYKDSYPGSVESNFKDNNQNMRPKNQISNFGVKSNGISGTYMRIIPKKPIHDYEKLYSENMQLRQKIQVLEDSNMKLKTRITVAEKQKQHILQQFKNLQNFSILKDRRPSHTSLMKKNDKTHKFGVDENRKILYEYKDEIAKLKTENTRLKKSVKYTQIKEIQLENEYLQEEVRRMKAYVQDVIENTEYEEYEREIEKLAKQLQAEKDQTRSIHFQLKKRDEEIEDFKEKMKGLANRKLELEKRYTRDINNMRAEVHRIKQKQKESIIHAMNEKKQATRSQHSNLRTIDCQKCRDKQKQIQNLKHQRNSLQNKVSSDQNKINSMHQQIEHLEKIKSAESLKKQDHVNRKAEEKSSDRNPEDELKAKQENQIIQKQSEKKKTEKSKLKTQEVKQPPKDDSDEDLYKDSEQQADKESYGEGEQIQMLHVDLDSKRQTKNLRQKSEEKQAVIEGENDQYGGEFEEQNETNTKKMNKQKHSSEEEEVLFQKEEPKKSKKRPASKKKKGKQKTGLSKAQKIMRQTIQYRLIAQRYTYDDLARDIKDSGATEFTLEDLINMTTNEPFYLSEEHLEMLLFKCFEKQELDQDDSLSAQIFLKNMKSIIGDLSLNSEKEEQKLLFEIHNKLLKVSSSLTNQFLKQGSHEYISKKGFMKVLKEVVKLTDKQIEQCLAQSSIDSVDIAHINHEKFKEKMLSVG